MMSKWSAKPSDYQAVRLRNNQRRHRKKVKDHIAELESRLSETQMQLDQALSRIAELSDALSRIRPDPVLLQNHKASGQSPRTRRQTATDEHLWLSINHSPTAAQGLDQAHPRLAALRQEDQVTQTSLTPSLSVHGEFSASSLRPVSLGPCTSNVAVQTADLGSEAVADAEEEDCRSMPLPEPGKPTTRCRDAFLIINQQNHKALDSSFIRMWLKPGYRRSISDGDGCRVDTVLLFSLLDWISGS
ncbi:hypothetical protein MGG_08028 [Pyricularia oryzae 70-15]|uniref:BZIP domain-containing protein n=3 Tax=Pyricularia oryzae TaxID=318829 RepID=A0A151V4T0_PYRO7|nr:uncharacterized protein MGG_08028 [Pyricularia oryzae 70-15]ELQ33539.1 hypothetical protein OOU_Y34scaffold00927g29 [Pyricularia oryzae Y34]KAI7917250.1 hypothetical protein M9X92_007491 [Pyricularia oryzae]KAI7918043.1 hypothetical protein M0657_007782 [Pyricularia oryzae]KYQ30587.1 hypothetical protein MGG_08028 [Pyricularia oryzae 70-15]